MAAPACQIAGGMAAAALSFETPASGGLLRMRAEGTLRLPKRRRSDTSPRKRGEVKYSAPACLTPPDR